MCRLESNCPVQPWNCLLCTVAGAWHLAKNFFPVMAFFSLQTHHSQHLLHLSHSLCLCIFWVKCSVFCEKKNPLLSSPGKCLDSPCCFLWVVFLSFFFFFFGSYCCSVSQGFNCFSKNYHGENLAFGMKYIIMCLPLRAFFIWKIRSFRQSPQL